MSKRTRIILPALVLLLVALGTAAWVSGAASIRLSRHAFSSGGAPVSSGQVSLRGTLGQAIAGVSSSSDGSVRMEAGYWSSGGAGERTIYIPLVMLED